MIIIGAIAAVLVAGGLLAWAVARAGVPGVPEAVERRGPQPLPVGPVGAGDIALVRFDQALRGYRMDQVDETLEVLAAELAERDAEIVRLRAEGDREADAGAFGRGTAHEYGD